MAHGKTIAFSGNGQAGILLDPNNWTGGAIPGIDDTALITTNINTPISGTFSINNMMLLGTERITFLGTLDIAGVGACKGLMVCVGAGAVFAPTATLNDGNVLIVGNGAVGTMVAQGSGTAHSVINTVSGNLGKALAGVGTVTIDDGIWNNSGHVVIGDAGAGTLNVIDSGMVRIGGSVDMAAKAGASGTMTIASGGSVSVAGTLRVGQADSTAIASVSVASGSSLTAGHSLSVGAGSEIDLSGGTVTVGTSTNGITSGWVKTLTGGVISGFGTLSAANAVGISDDGVIRATGGTLDITGRIVGNGAIQIGANSTVVLDSNSLKLPNIAFMGSGGTMSLAHGASVSAVVSGFTIGDMIRMANIDAVSFKPSTGVLTLTENSVKVDSLHFAGSFAGDTFAVTQLAGIATITLQHS